MESTAAHRVCLPPVPEEAAAGPHGWRSLPARATLPSHADPKTQASMNSSRLRMAVCFLALAASGCVTPEAYVENGHDKADYRELLPRNPPTPVRVVAEFRVNGQPHPEVDNAVFNAVVRVLQQTRVLQPVSGSTDLTLHVLVDDITDLDTATSQGWASGLTEGLVGHVTRDDYHFNFTLMGRSGTPQTGLYQHAMLTVSGRAAPPSYGQAHSTNEAFGIILKQSVLEYLHDFQNIDPRTPVMLVPDLGTGEQK